MNMTNSQQVPVELVPKDRRGRPAAVDGAATFASSDETIVTVEQTGELTALVRATGVEGDARVVGQVDADLGAGIRHVTGVLEFHITPGEAVVVELSAGTPEEQPETPPES